MDKKAFIIDQFNFFSSSYWINAQRYFGHEVVKISVEGGLDIVVYRYPLVAGLYYYYIPRGPLFINNQFDPKKMIEKILKEIKKDKKAVFLRIEPLVYNTTLNYKGLIKCTKNSPLSSQVSPYNTLVIDLLLSEEEILKKMKPKGRYNIKIAKKHKVNIYKSLKIDDINIFWDLHKELEGRSNYRGYSKEHYINLFRALVKEKRGALFIGEYESTPICAIIIAYSDKTAIYLHGASSRNFKKVMAPYLAQWVAMVDAKINGYIFYDFWGIAPTKCHDDHPWKQITDFKLRFGGEIISYLGAFDFPLNNKFFLLKFINLLRKMWK